MQKQYVLSEKEVNKAMDRLRELRMASLMCRDVDDKEYNRKFYLMAKGFEEALRVLGMIK